MRFVLRFQGGDSWLIDEEIYCENGYCSEHLVVGVFVEASSGLLPLTTIPRRLFSLDLARE